jgi:hypothetical protein
MRNIIIILLISIFFFDCGTSYYSRGWEFISDKDYPGAINYFEIQIKRNENNYMAFFGLGVSHYFANNIEEAIKSFEKANDLQPLNSETKYHLGLCYEAKKDYDNALKYYLFYQDQKIDRNYKTEMEKRYIGLLKTKYQEEAKKLIEQEKQIQTVESEGALTILNFENRSGNKKYDPLQVGFPTMFITDFSIVPKIKVIERLRLQALLDELKFNEAGKDSLIRKSTLQKAGKLLGAKIILKGGFVINQDNNLSLDLITIDVNTGQVNDPISKNGGLSDFYRIEKDLVITMLDKMGVVISDEIRQRILTIPTENFFAFLDRMKNENQIEKVEIPSAQAAIETSISAVTTTATVNSRLNTLDVNTGGESKTTTERSDVPSRFLPDPPLPPK